MKKLIKNYLAVVVGTVLTQIALIWVAVEFILYLVKDNEFNWTSVWALSIMGGLTVIFFILFAGKVLNEKEWD